MRLPSYLQNVRDAWNAIYTLSGFGTAGFVLSLGWVTSVTAGHTKRITVNAIVLIGYCVGS